MISGQKLNSNIVYQQIQQPIINQQIPQIHQNTNIHHQNIAFHNKSGTQLNQVVNNHPQNHTILTHNQDYLRNQ